jgi:hypothetical protein
MTEEEVRHHCSLWLWSRLKAATTAVDVSQVICPSGTLAKNSVNPHTQKYSCFQNF